MNKLLKAASYVAAPKLTFAARNPKKAALVKAGQWAMDRVTPNRRRNTAGRSALKGLGAAAVALPVGLWLGRKVMGRGAAVETPVR